MQEIPTITDKEVYEFFRCSSNEAAIAPALPLFVEKGANLAAKGDDVLSIGFFHAGGNLAALTVRVIFLNVCLSNKEC